MEMLVKVAHLVSLALWSGAVLFFSFFVALPTIAGMRRLAQTPGNWLGLNSELQGTRLAGEFLDLVFARYFPFQFACALVALTTACWWVNQAGWIPKARVALLALALVLVSTNLWYLGPHVHELRQARYSADAGVARAANEAFGPVHNFSLAADMLGLLGVLAALVLVLWLPSQANR